MKRKKIYCSSSVPVEACETRVLLSVANDVSTDLAGDAQSSYIDPYEGEIDQAIVGSATDANTYIAAPDSDAAVTDSPVSDYFTPFGSAFEAGQNEASSAQTETSADADPGTSSTASSVTSATSSESDPAATDEAFSVFSGTTDVAGFASAQLGDSGSSLGDGHQLGSATGDLSSGESNSSEDNFGDASSENNDQQGSGQEGGDITAEPDFVTKWTPLAFPDHVVFETTTLSNADSDLDWTAIQPEGTSSFTSGSDSSATVGSSADADPANPLAASSADLETQIINSQSYLSPSEWEVSQSYTNQFRTSATLPDETAGDDSSDETGNADNSDDSNNGELNRIGTETLTVTIIDGVSRTISYMITDTIEFEKGSFPDETENPTDEEKWAIPAEWIAASRTSVLPDESEDDSEDAEDSLAGASGFDAWDSGVPVVDGDEDQDPVVSSDTGEDGSRYQATSSSGFTVTETVTTLPDGTPAMTYTVTFFMSSSVTSKMQGELDLGFGLGEISESQNDGNGFKVTANAHWLFFSSASISTSFSASATVPQSSGLAGLMNSRISGSFGLDVSMMAGGAIGGELGFQYQTSSGDASDGSDSYDSFGIGGSVNATGYADLNFGVNIPFGADPETTLEDGEEVSQLAFHIPEESQDNLKVQLSTTANGSVATSGYMNHSHKSPDESGDGYQSSLSSSYSMKMKASNGGESEFHLGTEKNGFLIGSSGAFSFTENSTNSDFSGWDVGSSGQPESMANTVTTKLQEEQDYQYRDVVGLATEDSEATGDDEVLGDINRGGATFDYTRTHTHVLVVGPATGTYVELTTIKGGIGDGAAASQLPSDEDGGGSDSEDGNGAEALVKNKTLTGSGMFGAYVTVLVENERLEWGSNPNGPEKTKGQILAEYGAHSEQLYRLEYLLSQTNDPADRKILEGQIAVQKEIIAKIASTSGNAGITAEELQAVANQAKANVEANPPNGRKELVGGGVFDGSWFHWGGFCRGAAAGSGEVNFWLASPARWAFADVDSFYDNVRRRNWSRTDLEGTWTQTATQGAAMTGSASLYSALGLLGWEAASLPTYGVGFAKNGHAMFQVTSNGVSQWWHMPGVNWLGRTVTTRGALFYLRNGRWFGSLEGFPILYPTAATTVVCKGNCVWTALMALKAGMIGN